MTMLAVLIQSFSALALVATIHFVYMASYRIRQQKEQLLVFERHFEILGTENSTPSMLLASTTFPAALYAAEPEARERIIGYLFEAHDLYRQGRGA